MTKKFSLKDNPIFQRLEVLKPKEPISLAEDTLSPEETLSSQYLSVPSYEGQNQPLIDRPSKSDPHPSISIEPERLITPATEEPLEAGDLRGFISEGQNQPLINRPPEDDAQRSPHLEQKGTAAQVITGPALSQDSGGVIFEGQYTTLKKRPSHLNPHDDISLRQEVTPDPAALEFLPSKNLKGSFFEGQNATPFIRPSETAPQTMPFETMEEQPAQAIASPPASQDLRELPHEGQNATLMDRAAEFAPQELPHEIQEVIPPLAPPEPVTLPSRLVDLGLENHLETSLFLTRFNEMVDELLPTLNLAEQALYIRFFRLSYGFHRNHCTVSQPLLTERTGLSRNTIRTALQSLLQKGWIRILDAGNRISTSYRIVLPRERTEESKTGEAFFEGQYSYLQDLTLNLTEVQGHPAATRPSIRVSEFEGQPLPLWSLVLSARELVEKFYSRLGQRPSKSRREQGIRECLLLFQEGFTVDEIDSAISQAFEHHPAIDSFSQLASLANQAHKGIYSPDDTRDQLSSKHPQRRKTTS